MLFWTPRTLCILVILLLSVFALDAFEPERASGEQLLAFLLYLISSLILLALLILAWQQEWKGGLIYVLLGLFFMIHHKRKGKIGTKA